MERYVLQLTADGVSACRIAQLLYSSPETITEYWKRIRKKLHARNKTEAVMIAFVLGYIV